MPIPLELVAPIRESRKAAAKSPAGDVNIKLEEESDEENPETINAEISMVFIENLKKKKLLLLLLLLLISH